MGWADWLPWAKKAAAPAAGLSIPSDPVPDLAEFRRQAWAVDGLNGLGFLNMAALGTEVGPYTRPQDVPWEVLDAMGYDPVIYLGERSVMSVGSDPELYFVRHSDPRVVAETEAWLMPILADLIAAIRKAFSYGVAPFALSFEQGSLAYVADTGSGARNRKTDAGHVHYKSVHELWPGDVRVRCLPNDELQSLIYGQDAYEGRSTDAAGRPLPKRGFLPIWDQQWGRLEGMASRRRAYKSWYVGAMVSLWRGRYLERSVDVPRIGYAPQGEITVGGEQVPAIRVLTAALMALKNGSACVIPSTRDASGNELWRIDKLELPDRSAVWTEALNFHDAKKLEACLMPPGIANGEDVLSSAKVADALMRDFVQGLADFIAGEISKAVRVVYRLNGGTGAAPAVVANDVPQARRKILLEILKATINSTQHLKDGRTYTLGELVHPELLSQLGISARTVEEAAHGPVEPPPGQPGRPRDMTSDRETRREDARTDEGEDATGAEDEGDLE